jgi:hypothetical protein
MHGGGEQRSWLVRISALVKLVVFASERLNRRLFVHAEQGGGLLPQIQTDHIGSLGLEVWGAGGQPNMTLSNTLLSWFVNTL